MLKNKSKIFILITVLLFAKLSFSSEDDSLYFKEYNNKITIKTDFLIKNLVLTISAKDKIVYKPGQGYIAGLYGAYKKIGMGFGISVFDEPQNELDSKSKLYDFRMNYFGRRLGVDGMFQYYRGFTVDEISDNLADSLIDKARPNQKLNSIGLNFYYSFNPNHSFKAIYNHTERQLRSNGAFLLGLSQTMTYIQTDEYFFPNELLNAYNIENKTRFANLYSIAPVIGYQYTLIYKKFYFSPLLIIGAGAQFQKYSYEENSLKRDVRLNTRALLHLPLGYNGEKIFFGIVYKYDYSKVKIETATLHYNLPSFDVFFGMRFF